MSLEVTDDDELRGIRGAVSQLRDQLAARRRQAEELLAEAHLSEHQQRKRERLLSEETELMAQMRACEGLIAKGRHRLRASQARADEVSRSI